MLSRLALEPTFGPPSLPPININLNINLPRLREVFTTEAAPHPATSVTPEAASPPATSVTPEAASPRPLRSLLRPLLLGQIQSLLRPLLPRPPQFHSSLAIAAAVWNNRRVLPGSNAVRTGPLAAILRTVTIA
ncbi:uncharacterized protein N7515_009679 [Penicillium bovifimosum]|uniref:Uncharacterized protein n=1 Tax=Penicillium bovifimosum TaxID=126998 RepID=A0A9W9KTG0_9EURO|nr:uncharacterized protein N7515_009679 [Penicillium bovifimosum]KAJ5120291.1 hypothetical protein N7515_009679 [Penicillium bovifimosum]